MCLSVYGQHGLLPAETSVESVDVKLSEKKVTLRLKDTQDLSDDRIKQILTDAGYNVEKIERKGL